MASHRTPSSKRTRELLRRLPPGIELRKTKAPHLAVFGPDGRQLRTADGLPLYVTGTARGSLEIDVARIRKALKS